MDELAKALLDLDWSDMNDFALQIVAIRDGATEGDREFDAHYVASALVDWAHDNRAT